MLWMKIFSARFKLLQNSSIHLAHKAMTHIARCLFDSTFYLDKKSGSLHIIIALMGKIVSHNIPEAEQIPFSTLVDT